MSQVVLTTLSGTPMTVVCDAIDAVLVDEGRTRVMISGKWLDVQEPKEFIEDNMGRRPVTVVNNHPGPYS